MLGSLLGFLSPSPRGREMDSSGGEAGHSGIRPALPERPLPRAQGPSPDSPPSAPRSPRAPGCCLRVAAATRGAGCRRRCCRWT